jgi:Tfp pilus assembly protein FimT
LEAIRRGYPVVLCPAAFNASGNLTGCSGLTTWSDGVLIYQDNNLNGNYTENYTIPERVKLIKFSGQFTVNSNPAVSSISFDSKGNLSQAESFCLTKEPYKQVITVNVLGVANSTVTSCAGNTCTTCRIYHHQRDDRTYGGNNFNDEFN